MFITSSTATTQLGTGLSGRSAVRQKTGARGPNSDNLAAAAEAPAEAKPGVDAVLAGWAHTTRKLLKDIIDAGGVLDRDIRDDNANYRTLVGIINRRQMAPDGQQVIMIDGLKPLHIMGGFIRSVQHPVILGGCDVAWLSGAEVGEA